MVKTERFFYCVSTKLDKQSRVHAIPLHMIYVVLLVSHSVM